MKADIWLNTVEAADLASVSRQAMHKALRRGGIWRGMQIATRERHGCSAGQGGVTYEVALSSLSEALQSAYYERYDIVPVDVPADGCGYRPAPNQSERIERKYRILQEAMEEEPGSPQRRAEVLRASKKWRVPVRTIYGWLERFDASGGDMNALARKRPADAGQRRVWVSRQFDAAWLDAGLSANELPAIGAEIDHLLCRCWASKYQRAGWEMVRRRALAMLNDALKARGVEMPHVALYVSQRRVMQFQADRRLDIREHDRKRWDDMKPRIRRDASGLAPMETVIMDVKPIDNLVRRADGTIACPKMIAFQDWGTHRVFRYFVLLAQGEGVRQEHVVDAFKAMVAHSDWGFPQQLYRDNGTEFAVFDKIRAALELINEPGARTIINAKPYSGASSPIESKFATLDKHVFSQIDGYIGGDRLNKKVEQVGRPTKPYPGTFEQWVREADALIAEFETWTIKSGFFKGKSPAEWFAAKVAEGWKPARVDSRALEAGFARHDTRLVRDGAMSINGRLFRHPELPRFNGEILGIAFPYQRDALPLVNLPGLSWAHLAEDMPYLPGEIAGAIETARMQHTTERTARGRRRELRPVTPTVAYPANVVTLPTSAAPAPLLDLGMSEEAKSFAGARIDSEQQRADRERQSRRDHKRDQERAASVMDRLLAATRKLPRPDDYATRADPQRSRDDRITANLNREQRRG